ncbi:poly(A) RNA polymerase gld-2B-like [Tropilaelaps mercedesae]|uniref:Poly(A) RNA polymerase gld-2B-like n=1 Tax=Tropilaelaps mercedesae TaxID=418985 RepID=A0A1V9XIR6_9ACAR|nr:poly(A) RNA polymerase gld-2B-like [Tropilaelaps mercedesae]
MAPWKFQTPSSRWFSLVGYIRDPSVCMFRLSRMTNGVFTDKKQFSEPLQQRSKRLCDRDQPHLETDTRYDLLRKNAFGLVQTEISGPTASVLSQWAPLLAIATTPADAEPLHFVSSHPPNKILDKIIYASKGYTRGSIGESIVEDTHSAGSLDKCVTFAMASRNHLSRPVEKWHRHGTTLRLLPNLGGLFSSHPVHRLSCGPIGVQTQRAYCANDISGQVLSAGARSSSQQLKRIAWAPDAPLRLEDRFRGTDPVSEMICAIWDRKRQSRQVYQSKVKLRDWLSTSVFPEYNLTIIGSSASGYGFDESDVDMCMQCKTNFLSAHIDTKLALRALKNRLSNEEGVRSILLIPAVVPIIQFFYRKNARSRRIVVELNLNNLVGIVNTQLLYAYSKTDCRVGPFMLACKRWASNMQIKSAAHGTLSSYALTLLMLYFLQVQGVVPVLHHEVLEFAEGRGFANGSPLFLPWWKSRNTLPVGKLFREMLNFYADFDFENRCVCVRDGVTISKEEATERDPNHEFLTRNGKATNSRSWWNYILVQEPFNFTNVARAVYEKPRFDEITKALERSRQVIDKPKGASILLS